MGTTTSSDMDNVINAHFVAEANSDLDGVMATFTNDAVHDVVGVSPEPLVGLEAIRGFYSQLYKALEQIDVSPVRRYYGDDVVIDEVLYTGRCDGVLFDVPGTSGLITFRMLHVLEFRNALICRENLWLDLDSIRRQLRATSA
jgi:hypothetical protein